jgi:hypothetical protein
LGIYQNEDANLEVLKNNVSLFIGDSKPECLLFSLGHQKFK